ncbi:MAG: NCS2 family permease [Candidatus Eisenbacteria bacterium]|nr:NCS2 family permease [Candidatus Eisenbacteria bacterium]
MLERLFKLKKNGTTPRTELMAGATTFMAMAYIIFVNPGILSSPAGAAMDFRAVMAATCISSALATLFMAFLANYPIALAPGMGLNAFFSFTVCGAMGVPWQTALGIVFISGVLFTILTFARVREMIVNAIPSTLKLATAAGIGLFIAFLGLKDAGIIEPNPASYLMLGNLHRPETLLALFGLALTGVLMAARIRGGIFWGILGTGALGLATGIIRFSGVFAMPSIEPTLFKMNPAAAFRWEYLTPIIVFLFFDMFDTVGTLIGVGEQAGFMVNGRLPRVNRALLSDSLGTVAGATLGTSTVTSYIESAAGVSAGGRTGLANLMTAGLFILALFFSPLAEMFGGGFEIAPGVFLHPITAPALVIVGSMMMKCITRIDWDDYSETIPAFLTIIMMPLTSSIAHGLAIGFISYPLIKACSGRGREVHWLVYSLAALFVLRYIFV